MMELNDHTTTQEQETRKQMTHDRIPRNMEMAYPPDLRANVGSTLSDEHESLQMALLAGGVGVIHWQVNQDSLHLTPSASVLIGLPPTDNQISLNYFLSLIQKEDQTRVIRRVRSSLSSGVRLGIEFRMVVYGATRWLSINGLPVYDQRGKILRLTGIVSDVTERHRAEEQLRESEQKYRLISENTRDIVCLMDVLGRYVYVSPSVWSIMQFHPEELIGQTPYTFMHPEDRERILSGPQRRLFQGISCDFFTCRMRKRSGQYVWLEVMAEPIFDEDGNVFRIQTSARDITERKLSEEALFRSQEQLQHAQKMESIGRLAGGIAHDFNNLLTAILGFVDLAETSAPEGNPVQAELHQIQRAAEQASNLTRQLLAFSRRQKPEPQIFQLNTLTIGLDRLIRRLLGPNIDLLTLPGGDLSLVRADPGQIEQVIVNLVINARDAMPSGGTLLLETANVVLTPEMAAEIGELEAGRYVRLAVSDNGIGMPDEILRHIFEPFFTTKPVGEGTGLGLATCYGLIRQNGGAITVSSRPGEGSRFEIYLPPTLEQIKPVANGIAEPSLPCGTETILLTEDEPLVREFASQALRKRGYQLLEAGDAREALRISEEFEGPIALLVADYSMPGMNGRRLAETLRLSRPELKVLFASGYAEESILSNDNKSGPYCFLQKPYTHAALARMVRVVIDSPEPLAQER